MRNERAVSFKKRMMLRSQDVQIFVFLVSPQIFCDVTIHITAHQKLHILLHL